MTSIDEQLLEFQTSDPEAVERCGLILDGDRVIELGNIAENPVLGFETDPEELAEYIDDAWATWHTHPGQDSELTPHDYISFLSFPTFHHFIIGVDGVSRYREDQGAILNA